ncbi:GntR family transcriptional regulator [Cuniculiplasma sp. SKW4]|uniref:GntR family transcriptional regulator n=1 Tax=Cuniculiplasma sp. SKW4 TaxID=3400171 RepID=UPI003FD53438
MIDANSSNHSNTIKNSVVNEDFQMVNNEEEGKRFIISIDFSSKKPLFEQIVENIVELIDYGEIKSGTVLPSTRKLASLLGVNYHTVNKAYEVLIREGYAIMEKRRVIVLNRKNMEKVTPINDNWEMRAKNLAVDARSRGYSKKEFLASLKKIFEDVENGESK